jgi:hypothetical protein
MLGSGGDYLIMEGEKGVSASAVVGCVSTFGKRGDWPWSTSGLVGRVSAFGLVGHGSAFGLVGRVSTSGRGGIGRPRRQWVRLWPRWFSIRLWPGWPWVCLCRRPRRWRQEDVSGVMTEIRVGEDSALGTVGDGSTLIPLGEGSTQMLCW